MLPSLAIVDGDGALIEIEVLDPQPQALHEQQPRAIHELGTQPPRVFQVASDSPNNNPIRTIRHATALGRDGR